MLLWSLKGCNRATWKQQPFFNFFIFWPKQQLFGSDSLYGSTAEKEVHRSKLLFFLLFVPANFGWNITFTKGCQFSLNRSLLGNSHSIYLYLRGVCASRNRGLRRRKVGPFLPVFSLQLCRDRDTVPGKSTVCHPVHSFDPLSLYFHIF